MRCSSFFFFFFGFWVWKTRVMDGLEETGFGLGREAFAGTGKKKEEGKRKEKIF